MRSTPLLLLLADLAFLMVNLHTYTNIIDIYIYIYIYIYTRIYTRVVAPDRVLSMGQIELFDI